MLNNLDQAVVIYPEGIKHNPLSAKNVVRWMLGPPREADAVTYSKSDIIYWYADYYYTDYVGQKDNRLFIVEFHDDIFLDLNLQRSGTCYTIRKANPTNLVHPTDSIFIPFNGAGDLTGIANLFNRTNVFYSYDTYTFLSVQAAMCGCISVVVPDLKVTKEQWLQGSRLNPYGVAYGEDDIPRAIQTLPLLFEEIENIKLETNDQVRMFIKHCNNIF